MPKTNAERCRDYRLKKYGQNKIKKTVKCSTERVREFRARRKALLNAQNNISNARNNASTVQNSEKDYLPILQSYQMDFRKSQETRSRLSAKRKKCHLKRNARKTETETSLSSAVAAVEEHSTALDPLATDHVDGEGSLSCQPASTQQKQLGQLNNIIPYILREEPAPNKPLVKVAHKVHPVASPVEKSWQTNSLCRCCHAEGDFDPLSASDGYEPPPSYMLLHLFSIQLFPVSGAMGDALRAICAACRARLRDAYEFARQVRACDALFARQYSNIRAPVLSVEPVSTNASGGRGQPPVGGGDVRLSRPTRGRRDPGEPHVWAKDGRRNILKASQDTHHSKVSKGNKSTPRTRRAIESHGKKKNKTDDVTPTTVQLTDIKIEFEEHDIPADVDASTQDSPARWKDMSSAEDNPLCKRHREDHPHDRAIESHGKRKNKTDDVTPTTVRLTDIKIEFEEHDMPADLDAMGQATGSFDEDCADIDTDVKPTPFLEPAASPADDDDDTAMPLPLLSNIIPYIVRDNPVPNNPFAPTDGGSQSTL